MKNLIFIIYVLPFGILCQNTHAFAVYQKPTQFKLKMHTHFQKFEKFSLELQLKARGEDITGICGARISIYKGIDIIIGMGTHVDHEMKCNPIFLTSLRAKNRLGVFRCDYRCNMRVVNIK